MKRNVVLSMAFLSLFSLQVTAGEAEAGESAGFNPIAMVQDCVGAVEGFVQDHLHMSAGLLVACLAARPAILWIKDKIEENDESGYAITSIAGVHAEKKDIDGVYEGKAHVGSADVKVTVPAPEAFPFGKKKRNFMALLASFTPHIELGVEDKHSPIIVNRENVDESKVKRVFGRFSWGPWSARLACDVQDLVWVPVVALVLNWAKEVVPGLNVVMGDGSAEAAPVDGEPAA